MKRYFNITGACDEKSHYMVNMQARLEEIKSLIDKGDYFTINRARQYGKTTMLNALKHWLKDDYLVVSTDFQFLSHASFRDESAFVRGFSRELLTAVRRETDIPDDIKERLKDFSLLREGWADLGELFLCLSDWCAGSSKPVVLMIDEVDSAANNQVFLDFLSQLRGYYIHRKERAAFQSVILAGVYDIKNLKERLHPGEQNLRKNSPWNIAADFAVKMDFSAEDIAGMLMEYEADHKCGMNVEAVSDAIYEYTSGYPYLVSWICKAMDEKLPYLDCSSDPGTIWTQAGVAEAVKLLLSEQNMLFESLVNKLYDRPNLRSLLYALLFTGKNIVYNPDDETLHAALMFGLIKNENKNVIVANRIFETRLYNMFLTASDVQTTDIYKAALQDKNQFIEHGHLNMDLVLERFVVHFDDLYGDQPDRFKEEDGRRYFLLYLTPIINGTGNFYVESRTRNLERTDVIVDYHGERSVVELKIWRGNQYNIRGEKQLKEYLDYYHLNKGYMLSFNFNKNKQIGVKRIWLQDKVLIEAVV